MSFSSRKGIVEGQKKTLTQSEAAQSKQRPSQADRGPFWAEILKLLKPIYGLSDLLRAFADNQGDLSGRRNALLGIRRHLKADMAERRPFQAVRGPYSPKEGPLRLTEDPFVAFWTAC